MEILDRTKELPADLSKLPSLDQRPGWLYCETLRRRGTFTRRPFKNQAARAAYFRAKQTVS